MDCRNFVEAIMEDSVNAETHSSDLSLSDPSWSTIERDRPTVDNSDHSCLTDRVEARAFRSPNFKFCIASQ